jgi:hypothetical protein
MKTIKTPPEIEKLICEDYKNGLAATHITEKYKVSGCTLFKVLKRNKVPTKFTAFKDYELDVIKDFQDLTQTRDSILLKYKISKCKLFRILRDHNIPTREKHRKHFFNEEFFRTIDTPEKAQILGFIYADGCLTTRGHHISMFLHHQDKEYLEKIKNIVAYKGDLIYREARYAMKPGKIMSWSQPQYGLNLNSKIMYNDLLNLGLCPRKSWEDLHIPDIPKHLIKFFILGVLEGDGGMCTMKPYRGDYKHRNSRCIKRSVYWCGCVTLMTEISNYIFQELGLKANIQDIKRKNTLRYIRYTNFKDTTLLISWLYEGSTLRMERKFSKSREILAL